MAHGVDHAEGICIAPEGTLYVSGEAGQVYRIEEDGAAAAIATSGGWTLGLTADGAGRIYACDPKLRAVLRFEPPAWGWSVFSAGPEDAPFVTPNWSAFGPDGTLYVPGSRRSQFPTSDGGT